MDRIFTIRLSTIARSKPFRALAVAAVPGRSGVHVGEGVARLRKKPPLSNGPTFFHGNLGVGFETQIFLAILMLLAIDLTFFKNLGRFFDRIENRKRMVRVVCMLK